MKSFLVLFNILFFLTFPVNPSNADQNRIDKLSVLKTNTFIWGQVTACFVRFSVYAKHTDADKNMIETFLKNNIGDRDKMYTSLIKIGKENGALVEGVVNEDQWRNMVSNVAEKEVASGLSWLQTMGCYKSLNDLGYFD